LAPPPALPKPAAKGPERGAGERAPIALRGAASEPAEMPPVADKAAPAKPAKEKARKPESGDDGDASRQAAQVVSLDAFRKKP
jgi:hypothetical protein